MNQAVALSALMVLAISGVSSAQSLPVRAGERIMLVTAEALSSRTSPKGALVNLRTSEDFRVDDRLLIPAGTPGVGQVIEARDRGGLGVSGKLVIRPLYLTLGERTVRLKGRVTDKATPGAGGVIGVALVAVASGRTATIPEGTVIAAEVEKDIMIEPAAPKE